MARLMGHAFLRLARELGYKASYFNLVRARRSGATEVVSLLIVPCRTPTAVSVGRKRITLTLLHFQRGRVTRKWTITASATRSSPGF